MKMNLFANGTVMWPDVLQAVTGLQLDGQPYPVRIPSIGAFVEGVLYENLPESAWAGLDTDEGEGPILVSHYRSGHRN